MKKVVIALLVLSIIFMIISLIGSGIATPYRIFLMIVEVILLVYLVLKKE